MQRHAIPKNWTHALLRMNGEVAAHLVHTHEDSEPPDGMPPMITLPSMISRSQFTLFSEIAEREKWPSKHGYHSWVEGLTAQGYLEQFDIPRE